MNLTRRTWPLFVAVAIFVPVSCTGLMLFVPVYLTSPRGIAFDSARWKSAPSDWARGSLRHRMVDDFLEHHDLVGKSRVEIVELLGEPDDFGYFQNDVMVWILGPERSILQADSEWLRIHLDEHDIAVDISLYVD